MALFNNIRKPFLSKEEKKAKEADIKKWKEEIKELKAKEAPLLPPLKEEVKKYNRMVHEANAFERKLNKAKAANAKDGSIVRENGDEAKLKAMDEEIAKEKEIVKAKKAEVAVYAEKIENLEYHVRYAYTTFRQDLVDRKVILSLSHVKEFFALGDGVKTKAVHDVSFDVYENECFGLVGESGCGKTTTGRCIIKLYPLTSGSIFYKGFRISAGSRWNKKEIKWSKIHTMEKVKALKIELKAKLNGIYSNPEIVSLEGKYKAELAMYQKEEKDELAEINDKSDELNEEHLERIRETYRKKYSDLLSVHQKEMKEATDKAAKGDLSSVDAEKLKKEYADKIKALVDENKAHVAYEKKRIAQHEYDNAHVNKKVLHEIQMIFQDPIDSLDPRMTVEDIIEEGLKIQHQKDDEENRQKVADVLNKVGLIPEYASRYPHEFSGGQRQRIGIARALVMNPRFLVCDEPISALDVSIRAQILNLLNDVKEEMGLSILFIAHDLSVVKYFCDRIAVMYYGNLVELATSDELFKHPLHPYTKALLSAIPKPDPLSEKNRTRRVYNPSKEHDYSKEKPTLHEIIPGHFVLANSAEIDKYLLEIEKDDEALKKKAEDKPD